METIRIFIADDERPAREYLKRLLSELDDVDTVGEAENGTEALEAIRTLKPDLALLDLQMPEMSGIEVVRQLRKTQMPLVAFVTAFDDYAVQAFELNAVDYLLKPVEPDRLRETVDRARERLEQTDWRAAETERIANAAETYEASRRNEPLTRIPVKKRDDIYLIPVADVAAIVADGELLHITTAENDRYVINFRLKGLEARLDAERFIRLSRSALVNIDHVDRLSPLPGGTYMIVLSNGQQLESSRQHSKLLRSKMLKL
jgi:two-component system, LytTR family, response regulator